jgi:hypothetical protein
MIRRTMQALQATFSRYNLPEKMPRRAEPGQIHLIAGPMFSGKT